MSILADIVTRWKQNYPVQVWAGSVPNNTSPPYVVFTYASGGERRVAPSTVAWQEAVISFTATANTSVDAEQFAEDARSLYDMKSFGAVADMIMTNRSLYYTDNPSLTSNRIWVSQLDFAIKH